MNLQPLGIRRHVLRAAAVTVVVSILAVSTSGCSLFDFGGNDSFDEWYAGPRDSFDPDSIGFTSLDGGFIGYVLNDIIIRAPTMLVYETTRTAVLPLAATWYGCRYCFGADEHPAPAPTGQEASRPDESASPAGAEEAPERDSSGGEPPGAEKSPDAEKTPGAEEAEAAEAEERAAAEEEPDGDGSSSATSEDGDSRDE